MPRKTLKKTTSKDVKPQTSDQLQSLSRSFLAGGDFIGRHEEQTKIRLWLNEKSTGSVVYIYGPPGTGKTSLVSFLADSLRLSYEIINCAPFASEGFNAFFTFLTQRLERGEARSGVKASPDIGSLIANWVDGLSESNGTPLLVFDELESLNQIIVPSHQIPLSHFIVRYGLLKKRADFKIICIGNDLSFIEDIPKSTIKTTQRRRIQSLSFPSYSLDETMAIVQAKLSGDTHQVLEKCGFSDAKIKLMLQKAHQQFGGDVRKMKDYMSQILNSAALTGQTGELSDEQRWRQAFDHMKVILGSSLKTFIADMSTLPWQSQVVLYSMVKEFSRTNNCLPSNTVYTSYARFCMQLKAPPLEEAQVTLLLESLAKDGLISLDRRAVEERPACQTLTMRNASVPKNRSCKTPLKSGTRVYRKGSTKSPVRAKLQSEWKVYCRPCISKGALEYVQANIEGLTQRLITLAIGEAS